MLGLDLQIAFAKAWGDAVVGCMTACASASTALVNQASAVAAPDSAPPPSRTGNDSIRATSAGGRSWYRPPAPNPFDMSWFGLPMASPAAFGMPMAPFALNPLFGTFQPWQAWTALMMMPAPAPAWWAGWTTTPTPPPPRPPTPPATFATYRSESGHAVAQFTFPNEVVATVAVPPQAMALDTFFAWPATRH